ncbi:hypothetical protein Tco_0518988 [Tanacetum coccineum]
MANNTNMGTSNTTGIPQVNVASPVAYNIIAGPPGFYTSPSMAYHSNGLSVMYHSHVAQPTAPMMFTQPAQFRQHPAQPTNQVAALQDLANGAWNMDTGASSHLNNFVTCLSEVSNTCIYPSVSVSDSHNIPVTNTGHSILPT